MYLVFEQGTDMNQYIIWKDGSGRDGMPARSERAQNKGSMGRLQFAVTTTGPGGKDIGEEISTWR